MSEFQSEFLSEFIPEFLSEFQPEFQPGFQPDFCWQKQPTSHNIVTQMYIPLAMYVYFERHTVFGFLHKKDTECSEYFVALPLGFFTYNIVGIGLRF